MNNKYHTKISDLKDEISKLEEERNHAIEKEKQAKHIDQSAIDKLAKP
jgi:hypothetical protein